MSLVHALLIVLAGVGAGTINTIVGSGTLITFPTLVLFGVPPVTANISNTIGLVPGSFTAAYGYRHEVRGAEEQLKRLLPMSFLGGLAGALLLLVLPASVFRAAVPLLILFGLVLVIWGPRISAAAKARRAAEDAADTGSPTPEGGALLTSGVFGAGVYGGYFGAAQGVILVGILSSLTSEPLQRVNGFKNVLASIVNAVAAIIFIVVAHDRIDWPVAGLIAIGSIIGGVIGSTVGRRLSPPVLRAIIVVVGLVAIAKLVFWS